MSLLQNPCSVCGLAILSGDSFIGTGNGKMENGGSFAHDVCYYRQQTADKNARIKELEEKVTGDDDFIEGQQVRINGLLKDIDSLGQQLAQLQEENAVLRRLTHNDIVQQLMVANNERDAFKSELAQLKLEVKKLRGEA